MPDTSNRGQDQDAYLQNMMQELKGLHKKIDALAAGQTTALKDMEKSILKTMDKDFPHALDKCLPQSATVKELVKENAELKGQVKEMSAEMQKLRQEFETLKGSLNGVPEQLQSVDKVVKQLKQDTQEQQASTQKQEEWMSAIADKQVHAAQPYSLYNPSHAQLNPSDPNAQQARRSVNIDLSLIHI